MSAGRVATTVAAVALPEGTVDELRIDCDPEYQSLAIMSFVRGE